MTSPRTEHLEIFQGRPLEAVLPDAEPLWYWRLRAPNGRIIAIGGEPFTRRRKALRSALRALGLYMPHPDSADARYDGRGQLQWARYLARDTMREHDLVIREVQ